MLNVRTCSNVTQPNHESENGKKENKNLHHFKLYPK